MDDKSISRKGSRQPDFSEPNACERAGEKKPRQMQREPRQGGDLARRHEATGAARKKPAAATEPAYRIPERTDQRQGNTHRDHSAKRDRTNDYPEGLVGAPCVLL